MLFGLVCILHLLNITFKPENNIKSTIYPECLYSTSIKYYI